MDSLGKRIRHLRGTESQEDFARRIGVSKGSIGGYERDENSPSADAIIKICAMDDISSEWLLLGKGSMKSGEAVSQTQETEELKRRIAELEAKNALLQELARTRLEALEDKKETLIAYRLMLNQAQSILTALEKEGVIVPGAPNFVPAVPSTDLASDK